MNAPKKVATIRLRPEVYERLAAAAEERGLSINYLASRAIEESLDALIPADEWRFTKRPGGES